MVAKSSLKVLHLQSDDDIVKDKDSVRLLLQNTSWIWTFDPLNGALRSGISSGDINLINNIRLKNLLFTWQDVVADAKENEDRALNIRINSTAILQHVRNVDYRSTERTEFGKSKFHSDYQGLINDPNFEDYISERYSHMKDALIELNQVRTHNIEILDLIKHELSLTHD